MWKIGILAETRPDHNSLILKGTRLWIACYLRTPLGRIANEVKERSVSGGLAGKWKRAYISDPLFLPGNEGGDAFAQWRSCCDDSSRTLMKFTSAG